MFHFTIWHELSSYCQRIKQKQQLPSLTLHASNLSIYLNLAIIIIILPHIYITTDQPGTREFIIVDQVE